MCLILQGAVNMRILFINTTCGVGSHGRICGELAEDYEKQGYECKIAYGRACSDKYSKYGYKIGNRISVFFDVLITRLFDAHEYSCSVATKKFLKWADKYNPDIVWLHNIHGYYINYKLLFNWIKSKPNLVVKWTLHDSWAFTGHCGVFITENCEKWTSGCNNCPLLWDYPESKIFDGSKRNYQRKLKAFTGVKNLTLITPSNWLADMVKLSFLKDYPIEVHHNKVDTSIFKPTSSDFRERYGIVDKCLVLGVANVWPALKGLDDFLELAKMLDDNYVIALVGLSRQQIDDITQAENGLIRVNNSSETTGVFEVSNYSRCNIDANLNGVSYESSRGIAITQNVKVLYKELTFRYPTNKNTNKGSKLILINRTNDAHELAGLYTTADVYINPSHGDNYPTTNLEAIACGTFVITYDVGGSKETIR